MFTGCEFYHDVCIYKYLLGLILLIKNVIN